MTTQTKTNPEISQDTIPYFLDYAHAHGFGELHFKIDKKTGLVAIIAIHSTKRGPALGGCRFLEYPDSTAAVQDAMRLAIGMSAKAALANLPIGGGKSVLIKPKAPFDRRAYLQVFGEFIQTLNGRYITALDSGTQLEDMDQIAEKTPYVASRSIHGDPSPATAQGVFRGIEAAVRFQLKRESLKGLHIAVQGLGHVGFLLCERLHHAGAKLTVSDINAEAVDRAVQQFGATSVAVVDIHRTTCDVFSPCALGGVLNDTTIAQLQTSIIAGAANNQLLHTHHGKLLHEKGILYATDYVINAGGLIFAACKYNKTSLEQMVKQIDYIGVRLNEIFTRSTQENQPTNLICDAIALELLN